MGVHVIGHLQTNGLRDVPTWVHVGMPSRTHKKQFSRVPQVVENQRSVQRTVCDVITPHRVLPFADFF